MPTEPTQHDIVLRFHLHGDSSGVRGKSVIRLLDLAESALYDSDRADLQHIASALGISSVVRDATMERLRHYRHERIILTDAHPGSIELIGLVAAVSLYLLEKTVGEAFGDSVKESMQFGRLKEFFRQTIDDKALRLVEALRRLIAASKLDATVRHVRESPHAPNVILVDFHSGQRTEPLPTLGDILDSGDKPK